MFDFGWAEILIVGAIALFVIGPQDIPKIAYQIGKFFRRIKYMQYAITGQFDDFMKSVEDKENPKQPKQELDHDPMDEAEADAELMEMMPLPPSDPSLREDEANDAIQEDLNHEDTEAQSKIIPLTEKYLDSAIETVRVAFSWYTEHSDLPARSLKASLNPEIAKDKKDMAEFSNRQYWVAISHEQVAGIVGIMEMDSDQETTDWVNWFCVHPDHRGKGIGTDLLNHLIEISKQRNKDFLKLWTSDSPNEAKAQFLYDKMGFNISSTEPHSEGDSTLLIYREKPLRLRAFVVKEN